MSGVLRFIAFVGAPLSALVLWAAYSSGLLRRRRLTDDERAVLAKYAIHYQRLSAKDRERFEAIVGSFLEDKDWRGVGIEVVPEMKLMISACAAQLLRGFPDVVLTHFERIVVHPESYRAHRSGRLHQGEVHPKAGIIVLSWDDFVNGYAHSRDAHNVGLHEFAHALWFENVIINGEDHFLRPDLLARWMEQAEGEIVRIRQGQGKLLREYAGTSQDEFFAVAIEYFFELPNLFRDELPELYGVLSTMLHQDPAAEADRRVALN